MFEDDDYCLRLLTAGKRVLVDPATFFFHVGSVTMGARADYAELLERNRRLFEAKWSNLNEAIQPH
jgi:GT2 family glycosyltransferase